MTPCFLSARLAPWLRVLLGQIFIIAAWEKLLHPAAFADVILNYRLLPGGLVPFTAVVLPWVEVVLGAALVMNRYAPAAAATGCTLLAIFMSALGYNLARGVDVACGCFSTDPAAIPNALFALARDGLMLLLGLVVFWQARDAAATNPPDATSPDHRG